MTETASRGASFIYYGSTEDKNRTVKFHRSNRVYVCSIEGMPALDIRHPSYDRVKAAFEGWYQMSFKDWGASDIDWGDMAFSEKEV